MDYQAIDQSKEYKLYPQRFVVTGLFAFAQMMTSVLANTLGPIASELSVIYDEEPIVINLGGLLYILMHPIFTFPAAYVIDTMGTRAGIMLGSVLCIFGISLRLLVNSGFWLVIVGQVLAGIGRPFIMNCQAKISCNWFYASNRGAVTQLLTLVVNVSLIIGMVIPGVMFANYHTTTDGIEAGKQLTFQLMLVQAIMGYICLLPNILFQSEKPPTPPSESGDMVRQSFRESMSKLIRNKDYMLLLMNFGLYFGMFNAISITLAFILQPWFGQDSLVVSLVGGSPVISGIIGVMIIGYFQRKEKKFKKWILICMAGTISAMLIFYPLLQTYSVAATCFVSAYNSFFLIPLVPIMLELGCELVFPVGEGTAVGLLFAFGNLFGFILGAIMSILVDGDTKMGTFKGLIFTLGMFVIGLILTIFMKESLNREQAEKQSYEKRKTERGSSDVKSDEQSDNKSSLNVQVVKDTRSENEYVPPGYGKINGDML